MIYESDVVYLINIYNQKSFEKIECQMAEAPAELTDAQKRLV